MAVGQTHVSAKFVSNMSLTALASLWATNTIKMGIVTNVSPPAIADSDPRWGAGGSGLNAVVRHGSECDSGWRLNVRVVVTDRGEAGLIGFAIPGLRPVAVLMVGLKPGVSIGSGGLPC